MGSMRIAHGAPSPRRCSKCFSALTTSMHLLTADCRVLIRIGTIGSGSCNVFVTEHLCAYACALTRSLTAYLCFQVQLDRVHAHCTGCAFAPQVQQVLQRIDNIKVPAV